MRHRRFPIVSLLFGGLLAAATALLVPPDGVPTRVIGLFAERPVERTVGWPDRMDVVGGSVVSIAIDADSPDARASAVAQLRDRVMKSVGTEVRSEVRDGDERALAFVRMPEADEAAGRRFGERLTAAGRLEFRIGVHDSEFMERAVHELMAREPAGVDFEPDRWVVRDAGKNRKDVYFASDSREALQAWINTLANTLGPGPEHLLVIEEDRQLGMPVRYRTHYVRREAVLTNAAVASATIEFNPTTNRPEVFISFTDEAAARFGEITHQHVGDRLAIMVDGVVNSAPIIQSAITGGGTMVSMGAGDVKAAQAEAEALAAAVMTEPTGTPLSLVDVTEAHPSISWGTVLWAHAALALLAGLLGFFACVILARANARTGPLPAARLMSASVESSRRPWGRLAVTAAGLVAVWAGGHLVIPTVNRDALLDLIAFDVVGGEGLLVSVFTLGLLPFISASVLVEVAALSVPPWRPLRGRPSGRRRLELWTVIVGLVFALAQGFFLAIWFESLNASIWTPYAIVADPGLGFRITTAVTLAGGSVTFLVLAWLLSRFGLGNGVSSVLFGMIAIELVGPGLSALAWELAPADILGALAVFVLMVLATIGMLRARADGLRLPASSLVPAWWAAAFAGLVASLLGMGVPVPDLIVDATIASVEASVITACAFTAVLATLLSWLLSRAAPTSRANVVSALYLCTFSVAQFALGLATDVGVGLLITVTFATAIALDAWDEWAAWRRHGSLATAADEHRIQRVDTLVAGLAHAGIAAHPRGANHRALLHFFGPFIPVSILVPEHQLDEARRVLASLESEPAAATAAETETETETVAEPEPAAETDTASETEPASETAG